MLPSFLHRVFCVCLVASSFLAGGARSAVPECLDCHADRVDKARFEASIHAGFSCTDCHTELAGTKEFPHAKKPGPVNCGTCHEDIQKIHEQSVHFKVTRRGDASAPTCATCHGSHYILPASNTGAPTHKRNQLALCGRCHSSTGLSGREVKLPNVMETYSQSVHAKALARGNYKAAACTDCHGAHNLLNAGKPESSISRYRVPETCSRCHRQVYGEYIASIHGQAYQLGITQSPICTDCHGEHMVMGEKEASSPAFNRQTSYRLCLDCHTNPRILAKFGNRLGVGVDFIDSYHGLSLRLGNERAATCISCHGGHRILPARDPQSTISAAKRVQTCSKCHPNATPTFANSYSHVTADETQNRIVGWVQKIYIGLIAVLIGGMVLHNLVIISWFIRMKFRQGKGHPTVIRFNGQELLQHILLTISFLVLAITGFALRFPDSWFYQFQVRMGLTEHARGVVHRTAAIVLMLTGIYHVVYVTVTREGRSHLRAMISTLEDLRRLMQNMAYHLGMGTEKPEFDRHDYSEKMEYWALIWGTVIMSATGLVLWFPVQLANYAPAWIVKVSESIHFYEAILATLAILVWHFFFVILHPEEYPMSLSWLTGKMTRELAQEKYPLWLERMDREARHEQSTHHSPSESQTGESPQ